ncbi:MAG: hypothetical protein QOH66_118 [Actinomycetota bacterium]|nr:hypothetical protein [Actinomycetota bacterium]
MRFAAICTLIATLILLGAPAHPAAAADPVLTAKLVDFRPWLGPTNDLTATLHLTNHGSDRLPLSGLQIHVEVFAGPRHRTDLENEFQGHTGQTVWSDTEYLSLPDLAPGESRDVQFDHQAPLSSITFFKTGADDRAYPIRFTAGAGGFTAKPIDTNLLYFTEPQGVAHPLGVALVIPLDAPTAFDAQGRETSRALEQSLVGDGRINRILNALEDSKHAEVTVTMAPSGKFLDDLALMASPAGFTRVTPSGSQAVGPTDPAPQAAAATILRLRSLAARAGVRLLASPYSGAPLPALISNGLSGDVKMQVEAGRAQVKAVLGFDPLAGWLLPSGGLLDEATMSQLTALGIQNVVVSPSSLQSVTPPLLTPGADVVLKSLPPLSRQKAQVTSTSVGALVVDDVLSSRLESPPGLNALQVRQRFLAESATILLEQPAHTRSIAVLAPPDWAPDPLVINGVLDALTPTGGSPWMTGTAPDAVVGGASDPPARLVAQNVSDALPQSPGRDYVELLRSARSSLGDFTAIAPPAAIVNELNRRLLVAEGSEWLGRGSAADRGKAFARSVSDGVKGEFAKIQAPRDQLIVLTNRHATIPLALTSGTSYNVWVKVGLESDKLAFKDGVPCHSSGLPSQTTCLTLELKPGAQTVPVKATANFTGSFHVQVDLLTDTSAPAKISTGRLSIRSTAYNVVALALMAAAALFILFSWARGMARRRIALQGAPAGAPVD